MAGIYEDIRVVGLGNLKNVGPTERIHIQENNLYIVLAKQNVPKSLQSATPPCRKELKFL